MEPNTKKTTGKAEDESAFTISSNNGTIKRQKRSTPRDDLLTMRIPKPNFRRPHLSRTRLQAAGLVAIIVLSVGAGFLGGYWGAARRDDNSLGGNLSAQKQIVTSQSQLIGQIAKTVGPSVVSVDVISQTTNDNAFGGLFGFGGGNAGQQESAGTGIIISSDGLILTNRHVVPAGATSVSVTLSDGTELDNVQVVGRTSENDSLDVAFLKITDAKGHALKPAVIGDSAKVQVGDDVVAIGNALGQFQNTVTNGIISGYGRSVQAGDASGGSSENLDNLFQTDAAINEGNSGGPLVNLNGQVIGINTAIASNSQNVGFAIPINNVTGLIKQVEATGKFQRPYLGVRYVSLTADLAKQYSLSVSSGAFILPTVDPANPSVIAGGPADKAGLREKDIITAINGTAIDQTHSLTALLDQQSVGDKLDVTIIRGGKTMHVNVTLGAVPTS